jgi:dCTP diphosphatase
MLQKPLRHHSDFISSASREKTVKDLIARVKNFRQERDWDQYHSPKNLVMALMVEASELAEHFQWLTEEQSRSLPPAKLAEVKEEVGDVLIYLANLCDKLGIDPVNAAYDKLEKNRQKYPVFKVRGKSDKYSEYK